MKIALFYGSLGKGGTENTIVNLANELVLKNHSVDIIVLKNPNSSYSLSNDVNVISLSKAKNSTMQRLFALKRLMKDSNYDVVCTFAPKMLLYLKLVTFSKNFRLIGFERSNPFLSVDGRLGKIVRKSLSPWADAYVFQTRGSMKFYPTKAQKRGVVIQNGLLGKINEVGKIAFSKRNENKIVSVGRLIPSKGYDVIIKAFSEFSKNHPNHFLNIFGDGPEKERLQTLIDENCMSNKICLMGHTKNIYSEIFDARAFLYGSRQEGMPNALMEAMACGIPCISTNCDFGPSELIKNGENGILINVDDANEMYNMLTKVVDDDYFSESLSENAYKIRQTNDWKSISEKYINTITGEYENDV